MKTIDHDRRLDSLARDLLEWAAKEPHACAQTMDAWRTSCPRLAVWEEAVDDGYVARRPDAAAGRLAIVVTPSGQDFLYG
jgi:hypothetical protein